jgi:hypothetical protein
MYAIRVDAGQGLLRVEVSGRLVTAEALRAMSQAFTLAEASGLKSAFCDVRELDRGPAGTMVIAASLSVLFQPGTRIAFIARSEQLSFLARLVRFSGIRRGIRSFTSESEALVWLIPAVRAAREPSSTAGRHAKHVLGVAVAPPSRSRELATTSSESRHSAA